MILKNPKEFMKAKWAEPMSALNNMIFFMPALGIEGKYKDNRERKLNYTTKIPENYEEYYFKALEDGRGFNPMDALEKSFVAQGLDKTDKKLFKKIVKFRKILEEKEGSVKKMSSINKNVFIGISAITLTLSALSAYLIKEFQKSLVVNNSSNLKRERNIQ